MESSHHDQGDLGDIVRASGCGGVPPASSCHPMIAAATDDWQIPTPESMNFQSPTMEGLPSEAYFGDPFSNFRDPLLHELAGTAFFNRQDPTPGLVEMSVECDDNGGAAGGGLLGDEMIFSRVLQISRTVKASPVVSPRGINRKPSPIRTNRAVADHGGVQISSPLTPGIKRRKNQAKKVVCIPAPAAASSRPSGEIVPSDLWAWRKYGQKPIKGSPYPRGYYRCSSSKGCSARKQVERSRTDPNMLVITYTSEHNHPWPTQRNALAGSTRAQLAKNNSSAPRSRSPHHNQRLVLPAAASSTIKAAANMVVGPPTIKEEAAAVEEETEKLMDIVVEDNNGLFDHQVFHQSYKNMLPESGQPDDFFAELGELEADDPMSLVLPKEFLGDHKSDEGRDNKTLLDNQLFNIFDWAEGNSFGEPRRSTGL